MVFGKLYETGRCTSLRGMTSNVKLPSLQASSPSFTFTAGIPSHGPLHPITHGLPVSALFILNAAGLELLNYGYAKIETEGT